LLRLSLSLCIYNSHQVSALTSFLTSFPFLLAEVIFGGKKKSEKNKKKTKKKHTLEKEAFGLGLFLRFLMSSY
jgi:hypothetical protein